MDTNAFQKIIAVMAKKTVMMGPMRVVVLGTVMQISFTVILMKNAFKETLFAMDKKIVQMAMMSQSVRLS